MEDRVLIWRRAHIPERISVAIARVKFPRGRPESFHRTARRAGEGRRIRKPLPVELAVNLIENSARGRELGKWCGSG